MFGKNRLISRSFSFGVWVVECAQNSRMLEILNGHLPHLPILKKKNQSLN